MAERPSLIRVRRGDVYLVSFDPTVGVEIQKTRPALVIQNDIGNRYSPLTIVAAITSKHEPPARYKVLINAPEGGMKVHSAMLLNQIRSVDKKRLIKRLGTLTSDTMGRVDQALMISLGLVEL